MWAEASQAATDARSQVVATLKQAAAATGADFHYLLGTAMRESNLKPLAKSGSSSASGLFQFVDQTWMGLVKKYGADYGLGSYANAISQGNDGRYRADSSADRQAILALRNNPQVASLMAGKYAQETKSALEDTLGRPVCNGELYAAHFLGANGACKLIEAAQRTPDTAAASIFPQAAGSNRSVFYNADGTAKSVQQVYAWATKQAAPPASNDNGAATTQMASLDLRPSIVGGHASSVRYTMPVSARPLAPVSQRPSSMDNLGAAMSLMAPMSSSPLSLTPGVLEILASLKPTETGNDKDNAA